MNGVSDVPWVAANTNQYARDHGMRPFSVYQGQCLIMEHSFESEIIPMARNEGLALGPWDVLTSGTIRPDAEEGPQGKGDVQ
jgi:aryl-alcohol dehydrogenase-like predicted oxidoreductase